VRQVVISRHGGPEVLVMRDAPDPAPGEGQLRIRVRAAGINFADILARIGLYPDAPKTACRRLLRSRRNHRRRRQGGDDAA